MKEILKMTYGADFTRICLYVANNNQIECEVLQLQTPQRILNIEEFGEFYKSIKEDKIKEKITSFLFQRKYYSWECQEILKGISIEY